MTETQICCVLPVLALLMTLSAWSDVDAAPAPSTTGECGGDFQKLMICLDYGRGKVATPTPACCDAVEGIKEKNPKCLCYIIQQAHNGAQTLKDLGVEESKLFELPSACHLKNATVSDCPKLLGLTPGSPEAAMFSDNSTSATPTPAGKSSPTPSSPSKSSEQKGGSAVGKNGDLLFTTAAFVAIAAFVSAFPITTVY